MGTVDRGGSRLAPRFPYFAILVAMAQKAITYRGSRIMSALTGGVTVAIQFFLWREVFAVAPVIGGFTWIDMRTYILIVFALSVLVPGDYEFSLYGRIQGGAIAFDILRPVDFQLAQLSEAAGYTLVELAFRVTIAVFAGVFFFDLPGPDPSSVGLFLVSVVLGFLAKFLVVYLTGLTCFWLLNTMGLQWMRAAITNILSGMVVPLGFLPAAIRTIAIGSPFAGMVFVPMSLYLGHLRGAEALTAVGAQAFWVIILWIFARVAFRACIRRLVVQGG